MKTLLELPGNRRTRDKIKLPDECIEFLKNNADKLTTAQMAQELNVSPSKVVQWCKEYGIIKTRVWAKEQQTESAFFEHDYNLATI